MITLLKLCSALTGTTPDHSARGIA